MTIEEKAKAYDKIMKAAVEAYKYDKALKAAVVAYKDEDKHLKATLEIIFPELKENNESERIKKALIELVRMVDKNPIDPIFGYGDIKYSDMIAWLEKQGQQKVSYITLVEMLIGSNHLKTE